MASQALPPNFIPLLDSGDRVTEHQSIRIRYGKGYRHARPRGINATDITIPIAFILDENERFQLLSFLDVVGTWESFRATLPGYSERSYLIEGAINEKMIGGSQWRISFNVLTDYASNQPSSLLFVNGGRLLQTNQVSLLLRSDYA